MPTEKSLLLFPGVTFSARRKSDGWAVVVGDTCVGYFEKDRLADWSEVEKWLWAKIKRLYMN